MDIDKGVLDEVRPQWTERGISRFLLQTLRCRSGHIEAQPISSTSNRHDRRRIKEVQLFMS